MEAMRNPANWSDPPTADQIARAIVAASREVGADPIEVASGVTRRGGNDKIYPGMRARSYAAKALAKVFTSYPRTRIAGMVGCKGLVRQSYFSALDQRLRAPAGAPWWDEAVLARVVEAIGRMPDSQLQIAPAKATAPAPFKAMPYRPPPGTHEKTLAADLEDDDEPIFDRGSLGGVRKPQEYRPRSMSKSEMEADLRDAMLRTVEMQKPED